MSTNGVRLDKEEDDEDLLGTGAAAKERMDKGPSPISVMDVDGDHLTNAAIASSCIDDID